MSIRAPTAILVRYLVASFVMVCGASGVAHGQPAGAPQLSKEQREHMAIVHEKMAACLRSDKDIASCRDEMSKHCRELMGEQACPMMGMGNRMMQHGPPDLPDDT
jgi:hypothetical protein